MEQFIVDIIEYYNNGNQKLVVKGNYDGHLFRIIIIKILAWLKLEYKRTLWKQEKKYVKLKPLELRIEYDWCQELEKVIETEERFKKYFSICNSKFDFSSNVLEEEKYNVRKIVFENYNPVMME